MPNWEVLFVMPTPRHPPSKPSSDYPSIVFIILVIVGLVVIGMGVTSREQMAGQQNLPDWFLTILLGLTLVGWGAEPLIPVSWGQTRQWVHHLSGICALSIPIAVLLHYLI
jgi:hypothetical protein